LDDGTVYHQGTEWGIKRKYVKKANWDRASVELTADGRLEESRTGERKDETGGQRRITTFFLRDDVRTKAGG